MACNALMWYVQKVVLCVNNIVVLFIMLVDYLSCVLVCDDMCIICVAC